MIYENIPTVVTEAVRSIYSVSYVDLNAYTKYLTLGSISTTFLPQLSLVLCAAFAAVIVFVMIQRRALQAGTKAATTEQAMTAVSAPSGALRGRWETIAQHLDSTHESDWKVAVIEADKLVDDALARAGFSGETFGDRLSNIQPGTLLALDGVWWAHKIRNRLAHEADYFLRYTEARQAIGYYEAALAELQLL